MLIVTAPLLSAGRASARADPERERRGHRDRSRQRTGSRRRYRPSAPPPPPQADVPTGLTSTPSATGHPRGASPRNRLGSPPTPSVPERHDRQRRDRDAACRSDPDRRNPADSFPLGPLETLSGEAWPRRCRQHPPRHARSSAVSHTSSTPRLVSLRECEDGRSRRVSRDGDTRNRLCCGPTHPDAPDACASRCTTGSPGRAPPTWPVVRCPGGERRRRCSLSPRRDGAPSRRRRRPRRSGRCVAAPRRARARRRALRLSRSLRSASSTASCASLSASACSPRCAASRAWAASAEHGRRGRKTVGSGRSRP